MQKLKYVFLILCAVFYFIFSSIILSAPLAVNNLPNMSPIGSANANTNTDANDVLSQVTVAVTDRSATALQLALQSAFSETLIKMSGNPNIMTLPAIQKASQNLTQWVQSYTYIDANQSNATSAAAPGLLLQVTFDQLGLQQLLQATTQTAEKKEGLRDQQTITLLVSGVKTIADYVQLARALRAKNDVKQVLVGDMKSDQVSLQIQLAGTVAQFQQLLSADPNFKSEAVGMQSNQLQYYWMGNQA